MDDDQESRGSSALLATATLAMIANGVIFAAELNNRKSSLRWAAGAASEKERCSTVSLLEARAVRASSVLEAEAGVEVVQSGAEGVADAERF